MSKKLTLTDLCQKTKKIKDSIPEGMEVPIVKLEPEETPLTYFNYFADGLHKHAIHCHLCNHTWHESGTAYTSYYSAYHTCPNCKPDFKQKKFSVGSCVSPDRRHAIVREISKEEGYAVIDLVRFYYKHNQNNCKEIYYDGKLEFLGGEFIPSYEIVDEFIFSVNFGIRTFQYLTSKEVETKIENINSNSYFEKISKYTYAIYFEDENYKLLEEMLKENFKDSFKPNVSFAKNIVNISREIIAKRSKISSVKKTEKVKKKPSNPYLGMEFKPLNTDGYKMEPKSLLTIHYGTINRKDQIAHYCTCGHKWQTEYDIDAYFYDLRITCPSCGKIHEPNSKPQGKTTRDVSYYLFMDVLEETEELVLRYFEHEIRFNFDLSVEAKTKEYKRVFIKKGSRVVIELKEDKWTIPKKNVSISSKLSTDGWSARSAILLNSDNEVVELINKTDLKYAGILEAWGLIETPLPIKKIDEPGNTTSNGYLSTVLNKPYLEQIYKTGLHAAAKNIMYGSHVPKPAGNNVYELLEIGKPVFKMAREIDASLEEIKTLQLFYSEDQTFDLNMYEKLKTLDVKHYYSRIVEIKRRYNIKYADQIEYLKNCYDHQCIPNDSALSIWYDYLNMAQQMHYRLDDASHKYPSSLKKEHDRATFSYKVVKDKLNHEKFVEQSKKNEVYEYTGKEFIVRVPKDPNDVIEEGTSLKHCVASYVENIRNGSTVVAFIRRKDDPTTSFFTTEISSDVICQVKGYTNTLPSDKNLLEFIDEWAKEKNLTLGRHF